MKDKFKKWEDIDASEHVWKRNRCERESRTIEIASGIFRKIKKKIVTNGNVSKHLRFKNNVTYGQEYTTYVQPKMLKENAINNCRRLKYGSLLRIFIDG